MLLVLFFFFFFSLLVYFGHSNCGFLKLKQHWASSVLGWVTIWLGCSNPSIETSFNFFYVKFIIFCQYLKNLIKFSKIFNFYQNLKNLQFWPNSQISSILTKIWIIFKFDQNFKNLQFLPNFQKSSIFTKVWKIFNFSQIFENLHF